MQIIKDYLSSPAVPVVRTKKVGRSSDLYLKYCKKCNMVWEKITRIGGNSNKNKVAYYENFPTYGKTRKVCKKCK
tara:strand:+ start:2711 stop:2935 length:225 start_codon:yes stop_codon:yes gene_type:complete